MSGSLANQRPRPRPNIPDLIPGETGAAVAKPKRHVSDEGRQKLAEIARERHKVGGFKKGAGAGKRHRKPSRKRVAQLVAEAAMERKNAQAIIDVFKDGIAESQPMSLRLRAAEAWIGIEREEGKLMLKEEAMVDEQFDRDRALMLLSEKLSQGHAANLLRQQLESRVAEPIVDGEVVEDG